MRRSALGLLAMALLLPVLSSPAVADTVDPAPIRSFSTTFGGWGVAREPRTGLLYAPDDAGTVHVYAPTASGASPAEAFSFAEPVGCGTPTAPTFDASGQNLAVNCTGRVGMYSVAANGVATHRGDLTGLTGLTTSVFDAVGRLVVADSQDNTQLQRYDVSSFPAAPTSLSVVGLDKPFGLAMTGGTLYVANNGSSATVLALEYPGGVLATRTITAPAGVGELRSLQVDDAGHLYVGAFAGGVLVYAADANGASAPLKQLNGAASGLGSGGTTSLTLDAARSVYVSQLTGGGRFTTFAPVIPIPTPIAAAPGPVSRLHVTGKKAAKKRVVRWVADSAGTQPITAYRVVVARRTKVVLRKTTTAASLTIRVRKQLKRTGRYKVTVTALNAVGPGPSVSTTFRVKLG